MIVAETSGPVSGGSSSPNIFLSQSDCFSLAIIKLTWEMDLLLTILIMR